MKRQTGQFSTRELQLLVAALLIFFGPQSYGQDKKPKKIDVPDPERVLIETKDNVELRAEWFGGFGGKEAVPIMLLHDWNSDRTDLVPLATYLQKKHGHAVIVPDLRGHGESLTVKGSDEDLKRSRFKKAELASMFEDIDSCRRFLQEKNDAGELNLNMLVVLGCGKMGIHATNWCVADWQWDPIGGVKQGQNVKGLILVSPRRRFKSLNMTYSLKSRLLAGKVTALPILLVWGDEHAPSAKDSEAIYETLDKSRDEPKNFADDGEQWERQGLFRIFYDSNRESEDLLEENSASLFADIALFIERKVVDKKDDYAWQSRAIK